MPGESLWWRLPGRWLSELVYQFSLYRAEIAFILGLVVAVVATVHIVMNKRDSRAAAAWTGVVWLLPGLGVLFYLLLGINRIRRRARQLTGGGLAAVTARRDSRELTGDLAWLHTLAELVQRVTGMALTAGNRVEPMEAPAALEGMLAAVHEARDSVYLSTYIFGNDAAGRRMVSALAEAVTRGVRVRVLIDGMGSLYSLPPVVSRLRRAGVRVERFLYSLRPWRMPYINLRNHRKLLIIDRRTAFTGGMNLRAGYVSDPPRIRDVQCRLEGPVVEHLLAGFVTDWQFTCGEWLPADYNGPDRVGDAFARGIMSGPDSDLDKRHMTLLAALSRAEREIRIATPYFVPDQTLLSALELAALQGVRVQLLLPEHNNLRIVHWAGLHVLSWLIGSGVDVRFVPGCFDHSKIMTLDGSWAMLGSGNWDARSLRLNFEFDVECYDRKLAERLNAIMDERCRNAMPWSAMADRQNQWRRLRNALAHLLEPYL